MSFKPIKFGREPILKIEIKDVDDTSEKWTIMMSDLWKFSNKMAQKFGIKREDKDLDWLK